VQGRHSEDFKIEIQDQGFEIQDQGSPISRVGFGPAKLVGRSGVWKSTCCGELYRIVEMLVAEISMTRRRYSRLRLKRNARADWPWMNKFPRFYGDWLCDSSLLRYEWF